MNAIRPDNAPDNTAQAMRNHACRQHNHQYILAARRLLCQISPHRALPPQTLRLHALFFWLPFSLLFSLLFCFSVSLQAQQSLLDFDLGTDTAPQALPAVEPADKASRLTHNVSLYTLLGRQARAQHLYLSWRGVYENTDHPRLHSHLEITARASTARMAGIPPPNRNTGNTGNTSGTGSTRSRYRTEAEADIGRAWLRYALTPYSSLTLGRSVVVHGNADVLRQMDVVNALDIRYPGNSNLHQLRIPRGMLEYRYSKGIDISAIAAFEQSFNTLPPVGSYYSLSDVHIPRNRRRHCAASDYIINIKAEALGLVNQFQAARYLYGTPLLLPDRPPVQHFYRVEQTSIGNKYVGQAVELYSEISHIRPVERADPRPNATNWLLGMTWRGIANTQLQAEAADNAFEKQRQYAINLRRSWLHDRLTTTATWVRTHYRQSGIGLGQAAAHGTLLSLSADWEISDTSSVETKWVRFRQSAGSPLRRWHRKDHISVRYVWRFQ